MKIGLVTPSWPGAATANGIATAVANLADGLEEIGHEVTVIPHEPCSDRDPRVINLPPPRGWSLSEKLFHRLGRAGPVMQIRAEQMQAAALQAVDTRGIEALIMEESNGIAGMIRPALPIPVIVTLHGPHALFCAVNGGDPETADNRIRITRELNAFHGCDGVLSPSRTLLDWMVQEYGAPKSPTGVIGNPAIVAPALSADTIRRNIRKILFVGRFDLHKGGDVALEAFKLIAAKDPDVTLTFVGPNPGFAQPDGQMLGIETALSAMPQDISSRIDYRGKLPKGEILKLRQQHGQVIVASRYENFPLVVLEAFGSGMPTVATDVGGIPEIVADNENGLLVPAEDANAIATACLRLIAAPELAVELGAAAHASVMTRFAPSKIAEETVAFVKRAIGFHKNGE